MFFDDRLATVLRAETRGERAARTQYRQLLDLLGSSPARNEGELAYDAYQRLASLADTLPQEELERILNRPAARNQLLMTFLGYRRLIQLAEVIPAEDRSRILRDPGLRLRNRRLVAFLAEGDARPAAAAVATARLTEADWQLLIPRMPLVARGFLRHRRDLPQGAKALLAQLGVHDLVLPRPEHVPPGSAHTPDPMPLPPATQAGGHDGIRALLRRIEAFREGRKDAVPAPRLPLGDAVHDNALDGLGQLEFISNAEGVIEWASGALAPHIVGMTLGSASPGAVAVLDEPAAQALARRLPLAGVGLKIRTETAIAGDWRIDAEPWFAAPNRSFRGYRGRIRRPLVADDPPATALADSSADRMRQVLHELKTPVNAIQGFAEIIQQQIFGPAPNAYRALAAAVAVDAAKLLAAFDEIDRLARLESGALALEEGEADLREVLADTVRRLDGALRPRNAGFDLAVSGSPFTTRLDRGELLTMAWRVLASVAGSLAPSERVPLDLSAADGTARIAIGLPASLAAKDDPFTSPVPEERPALSAGMFGTGFSFRLARAEVLAAGGTFDFDAGELLFTLPLLTGDGAGHSLDDRDGRAA